MRYCVLYVRCGFERQSPWFSSRERAHAARVILAARYGGAVVFVD